MTTNFSIPPLSSIPGLPIDPNNVLGTAYSLPSPPPGFAYSSRWGGPIIPK